MYVIEERPIVSYWNNELTKYFGKRPNWKRIRTQYATKEKAEQYANIFRKRPRNTGMRFRVVELDA